MNDLAEPLLAWFDRHGRVLPWRSDRSPYRVVVSEFMLQQTQVARVIPVFERFIAVFDGFATLAAAPAGAVVREWRGLGYNLRAFRLQRLARAVCERHGGILPEDADALRRLPGVGPYTVGAIRAFAFDRDDVALDTNVRRIVHRVRFGIEHPPRSARDVDGAAAALIPPGRGNAMNSALMDLGSTICTARAPKCLICPIRRACAASPIDAGRLAALAAAAARSNGTKLPYERSTRYLRGRIVDLLRALPADRAISLLDLHGELAEIAPDRSLQEVETATHALARDGLVAFDGKRVNLAH